MTRPEKVLMMKLADLVADLYSCVSNVYETDTLDKKKIELKMLEQRAKLARELVKEIGEI